ncbi:MAG: hypothetical protein ACXVCF_21475, partial [Isosphaeraceae bacterium]
FGPAAFIHHRRPPTGWVDFQGPLRPRAFDLNALNAAEPSPWAAGKVLHNPAIEVRFWKLAQALSALYPRGSDEKRWVDGVLARKKGLGL